MNNLKYLSEKCEWLQKSPLFLRNQWVRHFFSIKLTALIPFTLLCASCVNLPQGYRYSLGYSEVEGNLMGPYMPIRAISPTEILAVVLDGNTREEVVLNLRGVTPPPSEIFEYGVREWLNRRVLYFEDEGLYLLKDTLLDLGNDQITGVVLYPWGSTVIHDMGSDRSVTQASKFGILQIEALEEGKLLHAKNSNSFSWDRDFALSQKKAKRNHLGYWENQ